MWHVLHLIARPFEALLGVFCVLSAVVLYPDEEGKIQSKFEDFWIRVDDFKDLALTRHAVFMTQVAKLESILLDGVFGHKLISKRALTFSVLISIASLLTTWSFTDSSDAITFELHNFVGFVFGGSVVLAIYLVVGSILFYGARFIWKNPYKNVVGGVCILAIVTIYIFAQSVGFAESHGIRISGFSLFEFAAVALAGFTCDVLFIVTTRLLIRWAGEMTSSFKVLFVVILNLSLAGLLVSPLPLFHSYSENGLGVAFLFSVGITNLWDSSLALFFVFLALFLLLNRALWSVLTRTLFRMTDIGTKGRRAILTAIGLALLSASVFGDKVPDLFKDLIKIFRG
jgi:hypothetical protein